MTIQNHPTVNAVTVNQISQTDISPICGSAGPSISCNTGGQGAVLEYIYVSSPINLPGIPPPGGWIITYTECCRNGNTNLNISANSGLTLYSKIYPYQGNNNSPCYDNSVDFLRSPSSITCSSLPQNILFFPYDSDLDSLSAKWATPLNSFTGTFNPPISPAPINFNSGYSFNNPFPNSGTGNVAAVLIEETGEIKFTSQQSGDFSYALIFESWRCGTKIAEVYKEFQIALISCGSNVSPLVSAPFSSGFDTTVVAGTLLNFNINATDVNVQNISWEANGNQFGSGFSNNSSGCTNPPCATLNPPPPSTTSGTNSISFNWQTDCVHLGSSLSCNITGKTYFFYLTAKDDFCPVPGINNQVIIVRLTPPPVLPSPEIKCISVINPATTSIQWEIPPDPNNTFSKYVIYFSNNLNGPYDTLTTINNYSQNQYTFTNPSGVINNYYFIKSFGCGGFVSSVAIDTVRPITLTVNNPSNGTAQLFWNSISNSPPSTSCGWYRIFKEYPTGVWTLIDSTQNNNFIDTITVCQSEINYRIEICDNSGCSSVSNEDGDVFLDQIDPITPLLDSVSMDSNGDAIIGWTPSPSQDVYAYVIYKKNGLVYVPVDTLFGNAVTSYTYLGSNASSGSETYVIAAYDSCGNISNLGSPNNTLFLTKQYDVCNFTSTLNWNPYINMSDGGLGQYEVLCSINGSPWNVIGSTLNTNFTHDSLNIGSTYCYKIIARSINGNVTSVSNKQCINASATNSPSYLYISRVTVNNNFITADGYVDNSIGLSTSGFDVFRSENQSLNFSQVGFINYNGGASFSFNDTDADPNKKSYRYFLLSRDSCDNPGIFSDTSESILCTAYKLLDFKNVIQWNDYSKWLGGVSVYNIYRSINDVFNGLPIASIPYAGLINNTYVDDVSGLVNEEGKFEYFIEAIEGPGNPYGIQASAMSNRAVVYRDAEIYIPNAFAPRGVNKIFKPVTQFIDQQEYKFSIFDRWGHKIWETNSFEDGWNGSDEKGGIYLWIIEYKNSRGEYIEKRGHVALIR